MLVAYVGTKWINVEHLIEHNEEYQFDAHDQPVVAELAEDMDPVGFAKNIWRNVRTTYEKFGDTMRTRKCYSFV